MRVPKSISRVHFIYLSIVFILIIGFISGFILFDNEFVVNIISVSSGIISIIIGMLAIFIAVYQGLTQGTSIQKINESAERVDGATKKLEMIDFKEFGTKINSMEDILTTMSIGENDSISKNNIVSFFDEESYQSIFIRTKNDKFISYFIVKSYNKNKIINFGLLTRSLLQYRELEDTRENRKVITAVVIQHTNILSRCGGISLIKQGGTNRGIKMLNKEFIQGVEIAKIDNDILDIINDLFD